MNGKGQTCIRHTFPKYVLFVIVAVPVVIQTFGVSDKFLFCGVIVIGTRCKCCGECAVLAHMEMRKKPNIRWYHLRAIMRPFCSQTKWEKAPFRSFCHDQEGTPSSIVCTRNLEFKIHIGSDNIETSCGIDFVPLAPSCSKDRITFCVAHIMAVGVLSRPRVIVHWDIRISRRNVKRFASYSWSADVLRARISVLAIHWYGQRTTVFFAIFSLLSEGTVVIVVVILAEIHTVAIA
mmetsp:Transcript_13345/g.23989  ORF Transcript_13345/g.23989 Transcript_13345/m.23989 type:complete len:235 (+) Transcript_13345:166-870(+)